MIKANRTFLLAAAVLAVGGSAQAQTYEQAIAQLEAKFAESDTNKDGKLTKQEADRGGMARVAQNFGRIDTNTDGFVIMSELRAMVARRYK
jgi:hypothetical protein